MKNINNNNMMKSNMNNNNMKNSIMNNMFDMSKMQNPFAFLQSMGAAANPFTMMQNFNPMAFMTAMKPNTETGTAAPAEGEQAPKPNCGQMPGMFPFPPMGVPMPGMLPFCHMPNMPGMNPFQAAGSPQPMDPAHMMQNMMPPFMQPFMSMMMMQSMMMNKFMHKMNPGAAQASSKTEEAKPQSNVSLGGMQISPELLHKLLSMDVSPESLNVLQKVLDILFSAYSKPKEDNEEDE